MKIFLFLLVLKTSILFNPFDYKYEENKFNKTLVLNGLKGKLIKKKINDSERFQGRYLGRMKTKSGQEYDVISFSYLFNLKNSPTAESHIFFYDKQHLYVGSYHLNSTDELPQRIIQNKLYFEIPGCKNKIIIDFSKGINPAINLGCGNENNYYEFQK
ncbi:hypothetical protein BDD43_5558 [Mucilaginibacter gracilis]|uniref:Uncharacterized protein n=1 Tax=Mucilaginibacter gracilis TaxID=423350 RepID=A0A495JA73_9SPHI|nr:hypothetical protein [Mucilaginibacter gracilis]RKR85294.1 hypothetical protein BDD43_5558 [Mucilaginibacter gracilis]